MEAVQRRWRCPRSGPYRRRHLTSRWFCHRERTPCGRHSRVVFPFGEREVLSPWRPPTVKADSRYHYSYLRLPPVCHPARRRRFSRHGTCELCLVSAHEAACRWPRHGGESSCLHSWRYERGSSLTTTQTSCHRET